MLSFLHMTFTHCSHYQLLIHPHSPFNLFLKNISSIFVFIIQFQESHTGIILIPVYFIVPWAYRVVSMAKELNPIPTEYQALHFFQKGCGTVASYMSVCSSSLLSSKHFLETPFFNRGGDCWMASLTQGI